MPRWMPKALEAAGWCAVALLCALCITQWFGIESRRSITVLQALTPYLLFAAVPIAVAATATNRHPLALTAMVPVITLLALSFPIVFHDDAPAAADGSPRLTVAFGNLYAYNPTPEAAAEAIGNDRADVMVMAEITPEMVDQLDRTVGSDYPYRVDSVYNGPGSIALWSRYPIADGGLIDVGGRPSIDVTLSVDGRQVRVIGIHTLPPTTNPTMWKRQLQAIGRTEHTDSLPTVVVGDFNASRFHPVFRSVLDHGWRDTHETLGHGWSMSWPMDHGLTPPAFVRLDHALFGSGVAPTAIHDVPLPGSDHEGFVATFGFTAAAT